jgi:UDP-N-acetylglucosamine transferase subunit ALG13
VIFVTVGTTMAFDKLIRQIDELVEKGAITEPVICQTGHGTYEPKHCEHFRFRPSLDDLFAQADLVVTHGGATVISLLVGRKPFVAVPNDIAADQHQLYFLRRLAKQTPLYWTTDLSQLGALIQTARTSALDFDQMPSLAVDLRSYLNETTTTV